MEQIIEIIMERDEMTREEAEELVLEAREEILDASDRGDYEEAEDILMEYLGLEIDYLPELIL